MQERIEQNALELLHAIREHHPDIYAGAWYLGLVPATEKSAERDPREKRISKEGEEMLRRLLVSGAHYILVPFGSDSDLRRHGEKIASRGAKNAKKRAVVAVARKLSVLRRQVLRSPEVQRVDREAAEALHQLETGGLDFTPHGDGPTVVRVAKALRHREDPSRPECRVELAPRRLPVAHLAEHEGEENSVESVPFQRPLAKASLQDADVGYAFCLQPMLEKLEHRTLDVEGEDLPGRFYRSRDGNGQPPGTTACIQYPHAGSEAETLD